MCNQTTYLEQCFWSNICVFVLHYESASTMVKEFRGPVGIPLGQGWAIILPQGPDEKPTLLPRANQHFVTRYQKDKTRCHSTNSRCRLVNFKHHVCQLWQERTHAHVISSQYVSISVFEWVFIHYLVINWPHKWNIADLLRATQNHQEGCIPPLGLMLPTPLHWAAWLSSLFHCSCYSVILL